MQPQPLMSNVPVFRLLVDPVSEPVLPVESVLLPDDGQAKHPKRLHEGQQSGAVYSNLVLNFFTRQGVIWIRIVSMLYQFLLTFTPLVLGAV